MNKDKNHLWVTKEFYDKVCTEISEWPDYKKQAYNEMFATSAHAKRIVVKEG